MGLRRDGAGRLPVGDPPHRSCIAARPGHPQPAAQVDEGGHSFPAGAGGGDERPGHKVLELHDGIRHGGDVATVREPHGTGAS